MDPNRVTHQDLQKCTIAVMAAIIYAHNPTGGDRDLEGAAADARKLYFKSAEPKKTT